MEGACLDLVSPNDDDTAFVYDFAVLLPNAIFIAYLLYNLRRNVETLTRHRSHIMSTYYGLVWAVCICNCLRSVVQLIGHATQSMATWNLMWLATRFVMIMLEVSVVVFLLHGYVSSSSTVLTRTLAISSALAGAETLLKVVDIYGFEVSLYRYAGADRSEGLAADMVWSKWGFWLAHALVFALVYAGLVLLPLTQWRDLLPAKDSFHRYVRILLGVNLVLVLGAALIGSHVRLGYCVYGAASVAYYAGYPPLLYATFLASFFQSEDVDLDDYYYSEMSEAGYFEGIDEVNGPLFEM